MRSTWMAVVGALAVAYPSLAAAQTRVAVQDFKGPQAKQAREAVEGVLEDHDMEIVSGSKIKATAKRTGAELDSEAGRVRVAKKLRLRAFVQGRTKTVKRKLQVTIVVHNGLDGMQTAEFTTSTTKTALARELQSKLWPAISAALSGTGAAPAAEPELDVADNYPTQPSAPARSANAGTRSSTPPARAAAPAPKKQPPPEEPVEQNMDDELPPGMAPSDSALAEQADQEEPSGTRPNAIDLGVAARFGTRDFAYNDSLPGLRGYNLGLSPAVSLRARWYPAAHFSNGTLAHLGLDLRGDLMVGVNSENSAGQKFSTNSHALGIGLRARFPIDRLELGAVAGFGQHSFGISNAENVDPDVPDVVYNFVRIGPDMRWNFAGPFTLQMGAAFLVGLSQGELSDKAWFPHTTGNGFEGEIGLSLAVSRALSIEANLGLQRYFMSLNPDPKDPGVVGTKRVAGGALDQYFSTRMGIALRP